MRMHPAKQILMHVAVVVMIAALVFPILLLVFNSLKTDTEIFESPMGVPHAVT
jgi:ABC-type glycerol-3-phosphate transport system permease component